MAKRFYSLLALVICLSACVVEPIRDPLGGNKDLARAHRAYVQMAMTYIQNRDMTQADRVLRKAADINEDDAALDNARGLFYLLEEDFEAAERHFERAIDEDPEFSSAYNNYAALLIRQGRYAEAVERLQVVTRHYRYDKRFQSFQMLGDGYVELERFNEAEKAYAKALQMNPRLAEAYLGLAKVGLETGQYPTGAKHLSSFEALSRPSAEALWVGIRLQRQLGDQNKLASYELALRKLFPASPQYREYQKSLTP
jgi:type IV pilus assembly protein PilF